MFVKLIILQNIIGDLRNVCRKFEEIYIILEYYYNKERKSFKLRIKKIHKS